MAARYQQIAQELREAIREGEYAIGTLLPSEGDLAARYAVSRGTVRQAVAVLEQDGSVAVRQGARRVVLGEVPTHSFAEMQSFSMWAVSRGHQPGARVLTMEVTAAREEEAARLRINPGDDILRLQRVRTLDDEPVMVERSIFPGMVAEPILAMDLTTGSITEQLTRLGFVHAHGDHLIDAVAATTLEGRLLGVRRGSPLLRQRWLASTPTGQPLAWSEDSYRHDAVTISVRNSMSANTLARLSGRGSGIGSGGGGGSSSTSGNVARG
jgi:GntR family transcriptional regulator